MLVKTCSVHTQCSQSDFNDLKLNVRQTGTNRNIVTCNTYQVKFIGARCSLMVKIAVVETLT
jgi:hypothetical protein